MNWTGAWLTCCLSCPTVLQKTDPALMGPMPCHIAAVIANLLHVPGLIPMLPGYMLLTKDIDSMDRPMPWVFPARDVLPVDCKAQAPLLWA